MQGNRIRSEIAAPATGSAAPIAPDKLIDMTKEFNTSSGSLDEQAKLLDDDYVFRGPGALLYHCVAVTLRRS